MENNYGTVRVFEIKTGNKDQHVPEYIDLDNVDLSGDLNNEIRERLETEEEIEDVESFDYEIREPGAEAYDTINEIREVLAKYFEEHSNGKKSKTYCSWFSAQDAMDEIADIIGEY